MALTYKAAVLHAPKSPLMVETVEANPHLILPPTAERRLAELKTEARDQAEARA